MLQLDSARTISEDHHGVGEIDDPGMSRRCYMIVRSRRRRCCVLPPAEQRSPDDRRPEHGAAVRATATRIHTPGAIALVAAMQHVIVHGEPRQQRLEFVRRT